MKNSGKSNMLWGNYLILYKENIISDILNVVMYNVYDECYVRPGA